MGEVFFEINYVLLKILKYILNMYVKFFLFYLVGFIEKM